MQDLPPEVTHLVRRLLTEDLEATLEAAQVGTWAWDTSRENLEFSPHGARLLGAPERTSFTFEECFALVHEDDRARVAAEIPAYLGSRDSSFAMRYRIVTPDGELRYIESRGRIDRDEAGLARSLVGVLLDVSEREGHAQELERGREQFRIFSELASDYVYLVDPRKADAPPDIIAGSFERITGYSMHEIVGLGGWFEVMHPEDRARTGALLEILRSGRTFTNEYRIRTKFGEERWLRDHAEPQLDPESGELVRIVGGVQDITERKLLEDQLAHAQRLEALARLSGSVAHDFNNLLTVMFSAAAVLDRGEKTPSERSALDDLNLAVSRAAELSSSLLAFARKRPTVPEVVSLDETIRHFLPIIRRAIGDGFALKEELAATHARVLVDRSQLELAVLNLALNARDALDARGEVRILSGVVDFAANERRRPPELSGDRYAAIDVVDQGPGIAPAVLARIFEPFFTTKPIGRGTGLGLSTVHGILRQFNGTVTVESVPGRGSVFTLYLPLATSPPTPTSELPPRHSVGGVETVWVVEDEPLVRHTVFRILESLGYRVRAFESAEELLEVPRAELETVSLLLSDVRLPGKAGTELAMQLAPDFPTLRIVLMSGLVEDPTQRAIVSSGRFTLLQKPFSPDGLARCLRTALETPQPISASP